MSIRWWILLTAVVLFVGSVPLGQSTQETVNERHRSAIQHLENDIDALRLLNIDARLRLLEDSREENKLMLRAISVILIGHIITAIWQNRRMR